MHSGASHSHTVCVISSAIKQCTLKLTSLGPVSQRVHAIIQPHIPQAWFGSCCCWKQTIHSPNLAILNKPVARPVLRRPLSTYSTKWCTSLKKMYSLYSLWMFPQCLSVASGAPFRTRKGCMQLITRQTSQPNSPNTQLHINSILPGIHTERPPN